MAAARGGGLPKLGDLWLFGNERISEEGFEALAEAIENGGLPSLCTVSSTIRMMSRIRISG